MRISMGLFFLTMACAGGEPDFVDDDGDGVQPPEDCDDSDPTVKPFSVDVNHDGVDADCDGQDGPGIHGILQMHASLTSLGPEDARGAHTVLVCDLTGDGHDNLLFGTETEEGARMFVSSSPLQPGPIATVTSPASFTTLNGWFRSPACGDYNGDGRDDVVGIRNSPGYWEVVLWLQPEAGFSGRLTSADALAFPLPEVGFPSVRFNELDGLAGTDLMVGFGRQGSEYEYWHLSGGTSVGPILEVAEPIEVGIPLIVYSQRLQLDADPELEVLWCSLDEPCEVLDSLPPDGVYSEDYRIGYIESSADVLVRSLTVGDFDGDGSADDLLGYAFGRGIDLFLDAPDQLATNRVIASAQTFDVVVSNVANLGDLDGDGIDDIGTSPTRDEVEANFVYSVARLVNGTPEEALLLEVQHPNRTLGGTIAGDFDVDGLPDIAFSAFDYDGATGQLGVYLSSHAPTAAE